VGDLVELSDRFEVLAQAAKGGMGTIYKARDRQTGDLVAVKLLHAADGESRLRFEREVAILAGLKHPRIVGYVAHGATTEGKPYLAMEWVDGETLHARLHHTPLAVEETLQLGRDVAEALGHAHAAGIVHRDIKPTNLIARDRDLGRISILDFGVARGPTTGGLTSTGALVGTPAYMAPEQARGERELGPAVDVFALGCVLYECLTGRRAFEGKHMLALIAKIVLWDPPRVRTLDEDIPEEFDDAVAAMMAKDRNARPRDGGAVVELLAPIRVAPRLRAVVTPARAAMARMSAPTLATPQRPSRLASIVVATRPSAPDAETPPESAWHASPELVAALDRIGLRHEVLADGSILVAVTNGAAAAALVERAVACAREIRNVDPEALIAVATGEIGDGDALVAMVGSLLEDTVGALAKEAMAVVFAGVVASARPPGAIRIDARTAGLLPADAIVRVKTACYVPGAA
jgi:serine/threonine protein kinase